MPQRTTDPKGGRQYARRTLPRAPVCAECEVAPAVELHHWDGNPLNNDPHNVVSLCRRCHMRVDGRVDAMRERATVWRLAHQERLRNRTHCRRGHEYTPANTYLDRHGHRVCRACHLLLERARRHAAGRRG